MEIIITIVGFWLILAISYAVYFLHTERDRKTRAAEFREETGIESLPLGSFNGGPFEAPARPTTISRTVPDFVSRAGTEPAPSVSLVRRPARPGVEAEEKPTLSPTTQPQEEGPKEPEAIEEAEVIDEGLPPQEDGEADGSTARSRGAGNPRRSRSSAPRPTRSYRRRQAS